ncbi:MAG: T9SS type A sorting domain-containing protein [Saprospiraceae bacterium]|nr:T9SS type A sorting domain-containing protein [Saprospiraceae bacterium]
MSLSSSSGGPDNLDYVEVSYSLDNGITYNNRLTIKGATSNNSTWAYSATGVAEVYYTPSNTATFQPSSSGLQTTYGYSTCGISFPGTISQIKLKIKVRSSSSSDTWCVDNVVLRGKKTCSNTTSTISETACNSFASQSGNQIWTTSGTYTDTIPNSTGCDSIITVNLTINNNTTSTINPTSCFSYLSPSGNFTWDTTGTYMDTIPNAHGCDSIMTINLTIDTVNTLIMQTGIALTANAVGATYQWLDCNNSYSMISGATNQSFVPTANGSYAVEITENTCVDTSICFTINNVGIVESSISPTFKAYPNPTSGKLNIDLGKTYNNINIVIRNVLGQIVLTQSFETTNLLKFEINEASGVYFVEIRTDEGGLGVLKMMKE